MARCQRCNKFMFRRPASGYCENCESIVAREWEEHKRKAEEERLRMEEEERKRKAEEERKRKEREERKRKAEEERKRKEEEERKRKERKHKDEEERIRKSKEDKVIKSQDELIEIWNQLYPEEMSYWNAVKSFMDSRNWQSRALKMKTLPTDTSVSFIPFSGVMLKSMSSYFCLVGLLVGRGDAAYFCVECTPDCTPFWVNETGRHDEDDDETDRIYSLYSWLFMLYPEESDYNTLIREAIHSSRR